MKTFKKELSVSIIFPNYNGGNEPIECLTSIKKLNYPQEKIEIIVVDNGSTDESASNIKLKFPEVNLVKNKHNLGFAKAVNQAIVKSSSPYIFVTNDDIVFEKNSVKKLVEYSGKIKDTAILGGKIFYKDKPRSIASAGYQLNIWTGAIKISERPNIIKEPDWVQGCAMLIPRKIIKTIGQFDEGFTHLFEDVDFCFRAKKAGFKVIFLPSAKFWHGESTTANKNKPAKYTNWYRGKFRFLFKNMPLINILSVVTFQLFFITPYRAIVLRDGRFWPFLKGFSTNIVNLPKTLQFRT